MCDLPSESHRRLKAKKAGIIKCRPSAYKCAGQHRAEAQPQKSCSAFIGS
jgi:hypothetical protein